MESGDVKVRFLVSYLGIFGSEFDSVETCSESNLEAS